MRVTPVRRSVRYAGTFFTHSIYNNIMRTRVILNIETHYNSAKPTGTILRRAVHTQDGRRESIIIIYESTTSIYILRAPRAIYYRLPARALRIHVLFIPIYIAVCDIHRPHCAQQKYTYPSFTTSTGQIDRTASF